MRSRRRLFWLCLLFLSDPAALFARPVVFNLSDKNAKKQVTFGSKTRAEYVEGAAGGLAGTITVDFDKRDLGLRAMVSVPVDRVRTGSAKRDRRLKSREWLNMERSPFVRYDLAPSDKRSVVKKGKRVWFAKVTGSFFLKGVSRFVTAPLTLRRKGKQLFVEGRFSIRPVDYGLRGRAMVHVRFRLVGVAD